MLLFVLLADENGLFSLITEVTLNKHRICIYLLTESCLSLNFHWNGFLRVDCIAEGDFFPKVAGYSHFSISVTNRKWSDYYPDSVIYL